MTIRTRRLTIDGPDGRFSAYLAAPAVDGAPGVIVLQEIFGVNRHIRAVTERFAEAGYAALAPDVFWRAAPDIELGYSGGDIERGRELKAQTDTAAAIADLDAAMTTLRQRPEGNGAAPGVTGYCYGGLLSFVAAARLQPACVSSYYGGGIVNHLHEVGTIGCPLQLHFGSDDTTIPPEQVELIRASLADTPRCEIFVYQGAGHGFHCDQRASYHADSAALAWERTLGLFSQHL